MAGSSYLEMNNCHINGVFVGCNGLGVITLLGTSSLKMTNTTIQKTFIRGSSSKSAGIYLDDSGTSAELYNCTFKDLITTDNSGKEYYAHWGGAIKCYGRLYCNGCNFINCVTDMFGFQNSLLNNNLLIIQI